MNLLHLSTPWKDVWDKENACVRTVFIIATPSDLAIIGMPNRGLVKANYSEKSICILPNIGVF
jgi:hypothetical protein